MDFNNSLGDQFVKRFALCYRSVVCPVLSICNVDALWPNGWMDQNETWHAGRHRPRHIVLDGPGSPSRKGHSPFPEFSVLNCCDQRVLDGVPALRERGTTAPALFGPCLLWPRSPISAILLSCCTYMETEVNALCK